MTNDGKLINNELEKKNMVLFKVVLCYVSGGNREPWKNSIRSKFHPAHLQTQNRNINLNGNLLQEHTVLWNY